MSESPFDVKLTFLGTFQRWLRSFDGDSVRKTGQPLPRLHDRAAMSIKRRRGTSLTVAEVSEISPLDSLSHHRNSHIHTLAYHAIALT